MTKKGCCVVPQCRNSSEKTCSKDSIYQKFPTKEKLRKKWLKAIEGTYDTFSIDESKTPRICSDHFDESCFIPGKNGKRALKLEGVPTLFTPIKKEPKVEPIPKSRSHTRRAASKVALKQMQILLEDGDDAVDLPDEDFVFKTEPKIVAPAVPPPKDTDDLATPQQEKTTPISTPKSVTTTKRKKKSLVDDSFTDIKDIIPSPTPPKKKYKLSHRKSSDGNDREVLVLKIDSKKKAPVPELKPEQVQCITNHDVENNLELECWIEELEPCQKQLMDKLKEEEKAIQDKLDELLKTCKGEVVYKGELTTIIEVSEQVQKTVQTVQASQSKPPIVLNTPPPTSYQLVMDPRVASLIVNNPAKPTTLQVAANVNSPSMGPPSTRAPRRNSAGKKPLVAKPVAAAITTTPPSPTISTRSAAMAAAKQTTTTTKKPVLQPVALAPPTTRSRQSGTIVANTRPTESTVEGGLSMGAKTKQIVDLTADESRPVPDSREVAFNKLQGKTYPSLVVVARPSLRVTDVNIDRTKLDAKVKSILMYPPAKFTEWLIQQGLVKSVQLCAAHKTKQMNLGMYSDVSKFPHSGGYVWIGECCPQRFVSVFSGSVFEGSSQPPLVILKVLYHWACQTNIPNILQWVKVDNLFVKGMYTTLRAVCTVAVQTHARKLGRQGSTVEVGVISLGTTSQDGSSRQVKVEVLGVLETSTKLLRLKAIEPTSDGERNVKKRFSRILEPLVQWVHPASTIVTDMTVDKATLNQMGFANVVQPNVADNSTNKTIMDYLRRVVPRMFQNTLSLLSRHIIQQFLDELVWREWYGTTSMLTFNNLIQHLSEQTMQEKGVSLTSTLNKVSQNPFKDWSISLNFKSPTPSSVPAVATVPSVKPSASPAKPTAPTASLAKPAVSTVKPSASITKPASTAKPASTTKPGPASKRKRKDAAEVTQKPAAPTQVEPSRPAKPISPDVPEQMVPLEHYYYGTIDYYAKKTNVKVTLKCPYCKEGFNNNVTLMHHLFKHAQNDKDGEMCRYCLTTVATANDLLKHIAQAHPVETKHDNAFVCLICETSFNNPFILGKHMSKEHFPSELPYQCGTCGYMCSNHKQSIDHFYKQHEKGPTIQCPFCLKATTIFSTSRNIVQNMQFFMQHLQKHQKKQMAKKCGKCNLWFFTKELLKEHQTKMHVSQRGNKNLVPCVAPRNGVMVPKSKMDKYPCDAEGIDFSILSYNISKGYLCRECDQAMDSVKHFPSFESCTSCQYSSCCAKAMQKHKSECNKSAQLNIPKDPLPWTMYCICGYHIDDGNQMAHHLAICEKKSAYPSLTDAEGASVTHSMLDVLGLVRKPEESDKKKTSETVALEDDSEETIPPETEAASSEDEPLANVSVSKKIVKKSPDTMKKDEGMAADVASVETNEKDGDDKLKEKAEGKEKTDLCDSDDVVNQTEMDIDARNEDNEENSIHEENTTVNIFNDASEQKNTLSSEINTIEEEQDKQNQALEDEVTPSASNDSADMDSQSIIAPNSQTIIELEPQDNPFSEIITSSEPQSTAESDSSDAAVSEPQDNPLSENITSPEPESTAESDSPEAALSDSQDVLMTENIDLPETLVSDSLDADVSEPQEAAMAESIDSHETVVSETPVAAVSEPQDVDMTENIASLETQSTTLSEHLESAVSEPQDVDMPENIGSPETHAAVSEPQDVDVTENIGSPKTEITAVSDHPDAAESEPQDIDMTENIASPETHSTTVSNLPDDTASEFQDVAMSNAEPNDVLESPDIRIPTPENITASDAQNTAVSEPEVIDASEQNDVDGDVALSQSEIAEPQDVAASQITDPQIIATSETDNTSELGPQIDANLEQDNIVSDPE